MTTVPSALQSTPAVCVCVYIRGWVCVCVYIYPICPFRQANSMKPNSDPLGLWLRHVPGSRVMRLTSHARTHKSTFLGGHFELRHKQSWQNRPDGLGPAPHERWSWCLISDYASPGLGHADAQVCPHRQSPPKWLSNWLLGLRKCIKISNK